MTKTLDIPFITAQQKAEIDRLLVQQFHVSVDETIEHTGKLFAKFCDQFIKGVAHKKVVVCVGAGTKAAAGLVAARYVHTEYMADVVVVLAQRTDDMQSIAQLPLRELEKSSAARIVQQADADEKQVKELFANADLIVDALVGYHISGVLHGYAATLAALINAAEPPIVALDIPSGLRPDIQMEDLVVEADATMAIALPHVVLHEHPQYAGTIYVGDIGIPRRLYKHLHLEVPHSLSEDGLIRIPH